MMPPTHNITLYASHKLETKQFTNMVEMVLCREFSLVSRVLCHLAYTIMIISYFFSFKVNRFRVVSLRLFQNKIVLGIFASTLLKNASNHAQSS